MATGQRVKTIRTYFRLGQLQFAEVLGISQSKLSYIEKELQSLSFQTAGDIIRIYNVDADWLYGFKGEDMIPLFRNKEKEEDEKRIKELEEKLSQVNEMLIKYLNKENQQLQEQNQEVTPPTKTTA